MVHGGSCTTAKGPPVNTSTFGHRRSGAQTPPAAPRTDDIATTIDTTRGRRWPALIGPALAVFVLMIGLFAGLASSASAAGGPVNQCNGVYNHGGQEIRCTVTVTNNLNLATGVDSSSVTVQECHGAAGTALLCTTTPSNSSSLTKTVTQCNGSANGGGARVTCSVLVTNNITGNAETAPATVNQCQTAGTGGGPQPTTQCSPRGNTTNADITQCNQSGNGGGATQRVKCTVTTSTSTAALPITINQCVGSANGGGSLVTCRAQIVNHVLAVTPTTTATATTTAPSTSRPRPSGSVRPSTTVRPSTSSRPNGTASVTTTARSGVSGGHDSATASRNATSARSTTSSHTAAVNATTSSTATTSGALASTGAPAARQGLLAVILLAAGAGLMIVGRRRRWIGKHR